MLKSRFLDPKHGVRVLRALSHCHREAAEIAKVFKEPDYFGGQVRRVTRRVYVCVCLWLCIVRWGNGSGNARINKALGYLY